MLLYRRFLLCTLCLVLYPLAAVSQGTPEQVAALQKGLEKEVHRFVAADRIAHPAPCQVLFVGSSSIVKWRDTLATDMAPMPVINRGFGGSQIEYINRWFDELVTHNRPRAIVFYAGENDLDAGKSVDRVAADFEGFMAHKTRALGDTPVYFISVKPSKLRFAELALQTQLNEQIKALVAKRTDLHYIDVVGAMLEDGKPKDVFGTDGLHMKRDGYLIWTSIVRSQILPNTEVERLACRRRNHL